MEIKTNKEDTKLTISLEGRLDAISAPELQKYIEEELGDITDLVFDLANLEYTSSAGLRVLLVAQQTMDEKGSMIVRNANETVMDIFEETGFDNILDIEE